MNPSDVDPEMNPPMPGRLAKGRRMRFGIFDLLAILTGLALGFGILNFLLRDSWEEARRARLQQRFLKNLTELLTSFPQQLGGWQMIDDSSGRPPFREDELSGWLARTYRHVSTGRSAQVAVAVSQVRGVTTIPLGVMHRFEGRKLVFTGAPTPTTQTFPGGQIFSSYSVHGHGRTGPTHFLRWSHWANGQWLTPQPATEYPRRSDAALQISLVYDGPPVEDTPARDAYFRQADSDDDELTQLCIERLTEILSAAEPN